MTDSNGKVPDVAADQKVDQKVDQTADQKVLAPAEEKKTEVAGIPESPVSGIGRSVKNWFLKNIFPIQEVFGKKPAANDNQEHLLQIASPEEPLEIAAPEQNIEIAAPEQLPELPAPKQPEQIAPTPSPAPQAIAPLPSPAPQGSLEGSAANDNEEIPPASAGDKDDEGEVPEASKKAA
jgi:hypothetical protein